MQIEVPFNYINLLNKLFVNRESFNDLNNAGNSTISILLFPISVLKRLFSNFKSIKTDVATEVSELSTVSRSILSPVVTIAEASIVENNILDEEKTKERIEQARSSVKKKKILQGQIIVREGEAVNRPSGQEGPETRRKGTEACLHDQCRL